MQSIGLSLFSLLLTLVLNLAAAQLELLYRLDNGGLCAVSPLTEISEARKYELATCLKAAFQGEI